MSGLLGGLGRLDVLDQLLLRLRLGGDDHGLPGALGLLDHPDLLDLLLLLRDRALHRDPLPHHLGHAAALDLDVLLHLRLGQLYLTLPGDDLQQPVLLDALTLHREDPLPVLLGDRDLPLLVLPLDAEQLLGPQHRAVRLEPFLLLHLRGGRLLLGPQGLDSLALPDLRLRTPPFQLQYGLTRVHVLARDLHLLVALEVVGADVLQRRQLGDLPDALGVQDVGRVELPQRGLLKVVDRGVLKVVAVQIGADRRDDAVPELLALGVEVGEVELLADRPQRLGELRAEQVLQHLLVTGPLRPDRLVCRTRQGGSAATIAQCMIPEVSAALSRPGSAHTPMTTVPLLCR